MSKQRIIGIVSGKGGVGKTVTAVNLGTALHNFGQNVMVVDTDVTASNLGLQLGFYSFPKSFQDVLSGKIDIYSSVYIHSTGLRIIPSSVDIALINAKVNNLRKVLRDLEGIVIVDSPPGLDRDALSILKACDEVIVVTNPEMPTITNTMKVITIAEEMGKKVLGVVVNRVTNDKFELNPAEIEQTCGIPMLSVIPEDKNVKRSMFEKMPLVAYSPFSAASIGYKQLAAKVLGKTYEPPRDLLLKQYIEKIRILWG